ncbi:ferritin [Oribacterium sp. WCC10]|uniref:ferritin n=1 Tax=Oribacterium sp. WCC10 TaxID=1855343 RepID=UPI0008DF440F|nr:ferritin [Oribacterium sp. WCC10]SFG42896.1 ferritin [Oribacterium sp. WCC10]
MNSKVAELLVAQVNKEFYSAYLYLGISKYFQQNDLSGFASWYRAQAMEEQEHALKFYDYLLDNDQDVPLPAIEAVTAEYKTVLDAVKTADKHEHYITDEINKIYDAAVSAKDYRTQLFLNWFITEQEEEEKNSKDMISKVQLLGDKPKNLYLLDKELAARK